MECTSNCLSKQHGKYLTSAFTIEDIETLKTVIKQRCSNPLRNSDEYGRSILHICASVGRYNLLLWLCDEWKTGNILQTKDKESGWTALHRAIYYGHIDCVIMIHKVIQDWHAVDAEGYSCLDLLVLDSPRLKKFKTKKKLAVVVLPFESGEAGELTLHSGDVIEIISTNKNGWGVGRLQDTGARGLFPINFVEEIKEVVDVDKCERFNPTNSVYMWGNNVNFVLGLGDSKNRANPELVECLWKEKRNIKDCVITKFHSVFLTEGGNIFTCGHGLGGRLGHEKEETVLYPKVVDYFKDIHCTAIDAAYSHVIVLDELGRAYTFGFNDFHQLGHNPPPSSCLSPKQINCKSLKNKTIIGVAAGCFHSVIYTDHEIYTFGLNAGQLGHPKGDKLQTSPKLVSNLYKKDASITTVVASDGATVSFLANGELYLFQDYLCRKIALRLFDVSRICVTGGVLQCDDLETFNKPEPLRIAILHNAGVVNVWRSGFSSFKICYWLGQKLSNSKIIHISLGKHLTLVTDSGQAYFGYFLLKKVVTSDIITNNIQQKLTPQRVEVQSVNFTLTEILDRNKKERSECEEVNLVKIPLLYRSVKCFTDSKSRTFAAIQSDARIGLTKYPAVRLSTMKTDLKAILASATLDDGVHDGIIKTNGENVPIHKFILTCRLNYVNFDVYKSKEFEEEKTIFTFPCYNYKNVMTWLEEVYIGQNTTEVPQRNDSEEKKKNSDDTLFAENMSSLALVDFESPLDNHVYTTGLSRKKKKSKKKSAYSVYQEKKESLNECESSTNVRNLKDIVLLNTLSNWRNYKELSDITIESVDGCLFYCHKCMLVGRTEYFNNMLNNAWLESSICKGGSVKIPIPGNILNVVINYLYTDEADSLLEVSDTTFIGEVLVYADQLLLGRLKDICELELADKVNLKNVIEVFQFACDYNIDQLRSFTCQFLSFNLPYFLEAGSLEDLPKDCLRLLSMEYRDMVVGMKNRKIKPCVEHRKTDEVEKMLQETLTNDLNKIRSRRGRLSSSKSKSLSSVSESDSLSHPEQSLSIHELPNDVFENSPGNAKTSNQFHEPVQLRRKDSNQKDRNIEVNNAGNISHIMNDVQKNTNGTKSSKECISSNHNVWNVNKNHICSSQSLSENIELTGSIELTPKKGIYTNHFKKKSQKDRKKERTRTLSTEHVDYETPQEEEKPTCPWGNASSQTDVKSFRDMLCEEKPVLEKMSPYNVNTASSSQASKQNNRQKNPWGSSSSECKDAEPNGFINIVHVQQEEKKQSSERAKKPLSTIQLEEKAIEELLKHYQLKAEQGEYITIKRIKPVVATPFWEVEMK